MHERTFHPWSHGYTIHVVKRAAWRATRNAEGAIVVRGQYALVQVAGFFPGRGPSRL